MALSEDAIAIVAAQLAAACLPAAIEGYHASKGPDEAVRLYVELKARIAQLEADSVPAE